MPNLGLQIVQKAPEENVMLVQNDQSAAEATEVEDSLDNWQIYFSKQFENLFNRVGKIKNYRVHADFFETLTPIQQKGRRVPITLQEKVDKEIDKLLRQGHIEKLNECSDKYFVSPIVITVKKDGSVKLALESRELNKQVHKNKYQMPNIEELMDTVGQTISERKPGMYIFLPWILRTRTVNYHLARKRAFNAIFRWWEENQRACIVFVRGSTALQPCRRNFNE